MGIPLVPSRLLARFATPQRRALLFALFVATFLKIVLAVTCTGTGDIRLFFRFAHRISSEGLCQLYVDQQMFNHTPLTAGFLFILISLAGGKYAVFAALLRLTCVVADLALFFAVLRAAALQKHCVPLWGLVLFALSPASILISGFHGNIDPIMTLFFFLAALACLEDRVVLSAVFFGIACNVKIVPIMFAPVFFFFWLHRGRGVHFALIAGSLMLLGLGLPLLYCPAAYLRNVFGYGSLWGVWGFTFMLRQAGIPSAQHVSLLDLSPFQAQVGTLLKALILSGILFLGWVRRSVKSEEFLSTMAMGWCLFFVFAPGMGVQYLVWFAPFLLLHAVRPYALITLLATAAMLAFYQFYFRIDPQYPWLTVVSGGVDLVAWCQYNLLLWLAFVATLTAGLLFPNAGRRFQFTLG